MKKKYILFDFDGTLINTNDVIIASWQASYEHFLGYTPTKREIEETFGETLVDTIHRFFKGVETDEVVRYYRKYQAEHCDGMVYVYDGIRELLTELKARGYKIGVATSRTSASLEYYINEHDIADFIDVAVTMDDVTKHKPHSETVDKTIEKLSGTPEESIMIGDTKYDIGCAMNAGVDSVLVGWSHYVDVDGIREEGFVPTYIIDKPADLLDLI